MIWLLCEYEATVMRCIELFSLDGDLAILPAFPEASDSTGATVKLLLGTVVSYHGRIDKAWCLRKDVYVCTVSIVCGAINVQCQVLCK